MLINRELNTDLPSILSAALEPAAALLIAFAEEDVVPVLLFDLDPSTPPTTAAMTMARSRAGTPILTQGPLYQGLGAERAMPARPPG